MTTHGHARTSTRDQKPAMQIAALRAAGVDEVHEETTAGAKSRPAEPRADTIGRSRTTSRRSVTRAI
jgi:DNA invertase Pin-like site-specific DNA recombinase